MSSPAPLTCVLAWGYGDDGELGIGSSMLRSRTYSPSQGLRDLVLGDRAEYVSTPEPVLFPSPSPRIIMISAGSRHTLAVSDTGVLYAWGWNKCGQLGIGTLENVSEPVRVSSLDGIPVLQASAGGFHSALLTTAGVYTCGGGQFGQLGGVITAAEGAVTVPQHVSCLDDIIVTDKCEGWCSVQAGGTHTAALTKDGQLYCWGRADSGQLGVAHRWRESKSVGVLGTAQPLKVDFPVSSGEPPVIITQVSLGAFHTACVDNKGRLWTFGKEDYGMLGYSTTEGDQIVPNRVSALDGHVVTSVSAGGWHTITACVDGVYVFGRGEFGRLGLGDQKGRLVPTPIIAFANVPVALVSAGGSHTLVLSSDGVTYAFGRGDHGRLGIGKRVTSYIPVEVHLHHEDDSVLRSPYDAGRKIDADAEGREVMLSSYKDKDPTATDTPELQVSSPLLTPSWRAVAVSAGGTHSLAIMSITSIADFEAYVASYRRSVATVGK